MSVLNQIAHAFSKRRLPDRVVPIGHPSTEIYADASYFEGRDWQHTSRADWDTHFDAIHGFTPEAFCYFLPGIFSAGIRENAPEMIVNESLIRTLDRGNAPNSWDDFFRQRWPLLSRAECEATQAWIPWLADADPSVNFGHSLSRAFDTMVLLANQDGAIPIAS